jgi:catecholate siderophore receptor
MNRHVLAPTPNSSRASGVLASAIGFALAAMSAAPADSTEYDPEIVVTGRYDAEPQSGRFTAPLLDTPKSVTVIPAALIQDRAATSLVDVLRTVPGITFNAGEGGQPAGDNLKIRGFDAGADVFVDGIRDPGSQTRDIFAVEQIEVVKGPGSAFTGRGASGGSVNLVTRKPLGDRFLQTNIGVGTDDYLRATVDANYEVSDSLSFRLNALRHEADVPGRDGVFIDHTGVAPSLALTFGSATRATLDYYYYRTDDMPDYSFPYGRNTDNTAPAGAPVVTDRDNFYGLVNRDFQETDADIGTAIVEHDFANGLTLRNTTRYGETRNDYIVTNPDDGRANVPNGLVLRNAKSRNSRTTTRANQTDLTGGFSLGSIGHSFAVGIEFANEEMFNRNYTVEALFTGNAVTDFANSCSAPGAVGAAANYSCTTLANPDPHDPWTGTITPSDSITLAETDTFSLYAFDTVELSDRWLVNLGVRFDDYATTQRSGTDAAPLELESNEDFVNYQLGIVYKPTARGSVYISTGTSSNPSGNTLGDGTENLAENNVDLAPERIRTYEIGTKWELLDNRVSLTAALFHTEKTNARVAIEPGRAGAQDTIGEQEVEGFELGIAGRLTDRWQMVASYTWLGSEILDDGPIGSDEGNEFPNTPEHSASLWTTYRVLPSLTIGAGATYVDQRYGNTANTVWIPSYVTYDAMAAWQVSDSIRLQLNAQNLSDEVYFVRPYANHYGAVGPARSAVLSLNVDF